MAKRLTKPKSVREDPYRNRKWNEIVRGRTFRPSDVPALTLLVQWYQVVDQCIEDLGSMGDGIQVAYSNDMGDIKALPQISTMKQASDEIRQLNKQLGINDGRDSGAEEDDADGSAGILRVIQGRGPAARRAV
ncbi:MAG: hypothetical protein IKG69_12195 [Atopobiaceae bacterium]|nr:hypothetical protein [Atopobiaceae bacterium]